jgi:hypothetical protein
MKLGSGLGVGRWILLSHFGCAVTVILAALGVGVILFTRSQQKAITPLLLS